MNIFHEGLYRPLFNLLIWLYDVIPGADIGFAIIALTALVKLALWPLTHASLKSQKMLQDLQPKLDALKAEHKDDKEALAKAMMDLYKNEKVNPLSSCLPVLVQIPILIALYRVLSDGLHAESLSALYSFVHNPGSINAMFLGVLDLEKKSIALAVLSGLFQFWQTRMLIARRPPKAVRGAEGAKDEDMLAGMNQSMMYFMPVMTAVIGASLPGGLTLYWVAINVISIAQQYVVFGTGKNKTTSS
ncbi:membrane protein insertase YidC [bacterium]|nr:membrane protein insertase YidC [bacterium]